MSEGSLLEDLAFVSFGKRQGNDVFLQPIKG